MQAVPGRAGQLLERGLRTLTGEGSGAPDPVRARRTDMWLAALCALLTAINLEDVHRFGLVTNYPLSLAAGLLAAVTLLWRRSHAWVPPSPPPSPPWSPTTGAHSSSAPTPWPRTAAPTAGAGSC